MKVKRQDFSTKKIRTFSEENLLKSLWTCYIFSEAGRRYQLSSFERGWCHGKISMVPTYSKSYSNYPDTTHVLR